MLNVLVRSHVMRLINFWAHLKSAYTLVAQKEMLRYLPETSIWRFLNPHSFENFIQLKLSLKVELKALLVFR